MKTRVVSQQVLLLLLACMGEAAGRIIRQLRVPAASSVGAGAVEKDLRPDDSKETRLVAQNEDSLLRFLDTSRNASVANNTNTSKVVREEESTAPAAAASSPQLPPFQEFRVQCLAHVHQLVDNIDRAYTDVQCENALKHECKLESEFPAAKEDGFHTEAACHEFAELLTKVRHDELATGSQEGYEEFCQKYYKHRQDHSIGTPTAQPLHVSEVKVDAAAATTEEAATKTTTEEPGGPHNLSWHLWVILLLIVVGIFGGIYFLRRETS